MAAEPKAGRPGRLARGALTNTFTADVYVNDFAAAAPLERTLAQLAGMAAYKAVTFVFWVFARSKRLAGRKAQP